jgi:hypothetical protein
MPYLPGPIYVVMASVFSVVSAGGSGLAIPILSWTGTYDKTEAVPLAILSALVNGPSATVIMGRKGLSSCAWRSLLRRL